MDYFLVEIPAGETQVALYGLNGAAVNFETSLGVDGPVLGSGQPMSDPEGFLRTITINAGVKLAIRVIASNTNGRDQPYTLVVAPQ